MSGNCVNNELLLLKKLLTILNNFISVLTKIYVVLYDVFIFICIQMKENLFSPNKNYSWDIKILFYVFSRPFETQQF